MNKITEMGARMLGPTRTGRLSYRLRPWSGRAWGGPLNGQAWRCHLVAELIRQARPAAIVETGTYLGTTTEWLSAFQIPVWSCEASERNFGYARQRLIAVPNTHLVLGDSRAALRQILSDPLKASLAETILFYLDAHWNEDLPLAEELDIIFAACPRAIVLIDDFQVPDDPGYTYDDYGAGKALTADYIAPTVAAHGLVTLYPRMPSDVETGAKRGCAVLARAEICEALLGPVTLLRGLDDGEANRP